MASRKKPKTKKGKEKALTPYVPPAPPPPPLPVQPVVEAAEEAGDTVNVEPKKREKTAYELKREKDEVEDRLSSVDAVEKLHGEFLKKLSDASTTLQQAIALAVNIETRCIRDRSNRELHLARRLQVKEMALFAASLNGQIQRFKKVNTFRVSMQLENAREAVRTPEEPEVFR